MTSEADSVIRTKVSLCTGTGALDRATPGELAWYSEIEPSPAELLKQDHPGVPNLGDITSPDFFPFLVDEVDLLTSGDPCQSMSACGRQRASLDERFLWPHVMGMIEALRPRYVFLENVQNIVSVPLERGADGWRGERGSVLKLRLDDLREARYAVKWCVIGACSVGAPHHRHRWFLRAERQDYGVVGPAERVMVPCGAPRSGGRVLLPTPTAADGSGGPGRSDKRHGGDNLRTAVTLLPTPRSRDHKGGSTGDRPIDGGPDLPTAINLLPTPRATDIGTMGRRSSEGWRPQLGQAVMEQWGKFAEAVALWEQITGRAAPVPTVPGARGGVRLNPALSEWMMDYPPGFLTERLERPAALKAAGNGVVERQARAAWDLLA